MATRVGEPVKVRYRKGVFEPVEPVDLPEDTEGEVIIANRFFELLDKARANVAASGVTGEEFDEIAREACEDARRKTWEEVQKRARGTA